MKVKNILIIEDDPFFAKGFMKRLTNVTQAKLHLEASIESAMRNITGIKPELIFLDHYLEGENGVDALPKIQKLCPDAEIVVVSNSTDLNVLKNALERGAAKYFTKDSLLTLNVNEFIEEMIEKSSGYETFWEHFLNTYTGSLPVK